MSPAYHYNPNEKPDVDVAEGSIEPYKIFVDYEATPIKRRMIDPPLRLVSVVLFAGFYVLYVLNLGGSEFLCHDSGLGGLLRHFPPMFFMAYCLFLGHGVASRQRLIRWDIWIVVGDVVSLIVGLVVGEVLVRYDDTRCEALQCRGQT